METTAFQPRRGATGWGRMARFAAVGASGVVVNTALLLALTRAGGLAEWQASPLATEAAILSNFLLNDAWTFRDARAGSGLGRLLRYNGVALGGMAVTVAALTLLTRVLGVGLMPANLLAVACAMAWNYLINSRWTWGARYVQPAPAARRSHEECHAMRTLVIVPTYNERENIERLVPAILAQDETFDVLVVDDGSPDGTGQVARGMAARSHRVNLLQRARKEGLGTAYLAGFRRALSWGYHTVVEMDADFSHSPADLPRLVAPVRAGEADLALGSRWVSGGGTRGWPLRRRLISRGGSLYARAILGVGVRDLTGGFKCFSRAALRTLDLDGVRSNGYSFQIELTYRALRAGMRVVELPIVFTERERGVSKMSGAIVREAIAVVWRLRLERAPATAAAPAPEPELARAVGGEEERL
ncbi:MAG TPA: glycosyltransferase [Chloroflexaceae bacterium]|nr:glycosyltransferase [Chloroflexaceae bacterium]